MKRPKLDRLLRVTAWIAAINFLAFFFGCMVLGGDALNGYERDGRYFVMSHGHYTEVSWPLFIYSKVHGWSMWVTHSSVFLVALVGHLLEKRTKRKRAS